MLKLRQPAPRTNSVALNQVKSANRSEFAAVEKRTMKAHVIMASHKMRQPVPVLVTTTMVIESDQPGVSNQVWVVRTWHVALYYPTAEQSKQVPPRKI
jgi:hypothetical protein